MLAIIIFAICIMYTPGPVNLLSLNNGLQKRFLAHIPFSIGVGIALFLWFLIIGYSGTSIIQESMLPYLGILGSGMITYLAFKILQAPLHSGAGEAKHLTFTDGLLMQLLNPKSFLVVLPVATVQFPAAGIQGSAIVVWSLALGLLGTGAPISYAAIGTLVGRRDVCTTKFLNRCNTVMGIILLAVAADIAYRFSYLPLLS